MEREQGRNDKNIIKKIQDNTKYAGKLATRKVIFACVRG